MERTMAAKPPSSTSTALRPGALRVAIVGATGAVGKNMLRLVEERGIASEAVLFASERSEGRLIGQRRVQALTPESVQGFDLALFSAGTAVSREWAEAFVAGGALVVDNSTAWRTDPEVPLVVPEINPQAALHHPKGIIANPNCVTIICLMALGPLHRAFALREAIISSYQSAGGAGERGMAELEAQITPALEHRERLLSPEGALELLGETTIHKKPLAFNVVPILGTPETGGYTDEELKLMTESRKILSLPDLKVTPTCVRVPVWVGHSASIHAIFSKAPELSQVKKVLDEAPGVVLEDVPTPLEQSGRDEVAVGRIRADLSDPLALNFFVSGDNLLKGAALNAVQIVDLLWPR